MNSSSSLIPITTKEWSNFLIVYFASHEIYIKSSIFTYRQKKSRRIFFFFPGSRKNIFKKKLFISGLTFNKFQQQQELLPFFFLSAELLKKSLFFCFALALTDAENPTVFSFFFSSAFCLPACRGHGPNSNIFSLSIWHFWFIRSDVYNNSYTFRVCFFGSPSFTSLCWIKAF